MPRYHANVRFGPWRRGDEFESEDELHAKMAVNSGLLSVIDEEDPEADGPSSQWPPPTDETSPEQPSFDWGENLGGPDL